MASLLLRAIAIFYVAIITSSEATLIHPIGGAIAAATAGKVFFKGAIIAAAGAIAAGAFHKSLEDYWKQNVGPNTQMPKAIKNCMNEHVNMQGSLKVDVKSMIRFKSYSYPNVTDININITINVEFWAKSEGGESLTTSSSKTHAPTSAPQQDSNTIASIEDSMASMFFTEEALSLGKILHLYFTKSPNMAPFLPKGLVDKLPFTLENFHEILNQFNLTEDSIEAKVMKETLKYCEDDKGGDKCCNSLESMVEFAKSIVGPNSIKAISMNEEKDSKMEYNVHGIRKVQSGPHAVTCRKIPFPCAMFYCQKEENVTVYVANLVGNDGSSFNVPALCHENTKSWDPNHWVFKVLHAKPGSCPICHFLLDDDVLWIGQ